MDLKSHFLQFTKAELTDNCRFFGVKGYSSLKKEQIADKLIANICSEAVMPEYVSAFTPQQIALLKNGMDQEGVVYEPGQCGMVEDLDRLYYGHMDEEEGVFYTYEEIADALEKNLEVAQAKSPEKKAWLMKCLYYFTRYYGMGAAEILYELYKLKETDSIEEMMELMRQIPSAITEMIFISKEQCAEIAKALSEMIETQYGAYVFYEFFEASEMHALIDKQRGKPFYIPSAEQIEEIYEQGYEASNMAVAEMEEALEKIAGASKQDAKDLTQIFAGLVYLGESLDSFMDLLAGMDYEISPENMNELRASAQDVLNETAVLENRGFSRQGLEDYYEGGGVLTLNLMPKSVQPASSKPKKAQGYYTKPGTRTLMKKEKIGPNDLCPCGSGKKYKKCCGRKGK